MKGAAETPVMDFAAWFGVGNEPIVELDDDIWVALGHHSPEAFAALYRAGAEPFYDDVQPIPAADVHTCWAVIEPSWPGAPDDEWTVRFDATWATPGAARVTWGQPPLPAADERLRLVDGQGGGRRG